MLIRGFLLLLGVCLAVVLSALPASAQTRLETLDAPAARDLLYDTSRDLLYISTDTGEILRYRVAGREFLSPILVADGRLRGLTISPDRSTLAVVELPTADVSYAEDWTGLFLIDLESLAVSDVRDPARPTAGLAFDALFLSDESILYSSVRSITARAIPSLLRRYDRGAETISSVAGSVGPSDIALSPDRNRVVISSVVEEQLGWYDVLTGLAPIRPDAGGHSPTFLDDAAVFATARGGSSVSLWRDVSGTVRPGTSFLRPAFLGTNYAGDSVSLLWSARSRRLYVTWAGSVGSSLTVHEGPNQFSAIRYLGVLDTALQYPLGTTNPIAARSLGAMEILPDESRLFVVALDGVRVYDPNVLGDIDADGIPDEVDNCASDANPDQSDTDLSGIGDACNAVRDPDGDEFETGRDNCPDVFNPLQTNTDLGPLGDACNDEEDRDGDEWRDVVDNCPDTFNDQANEDGDAFGDACDPFPLDTDHVLAQTRLERDLALQEVDRLSAELSICLEPPDTDGDGVPDVDDACLDTGTGLLVDGAGCSQAQFCAGVPIQPITWSTLRGCISADWLAPSGSNWGDCRPAWIEGQIVCAAFSR